MKRHHDYLKRASLMTAFLLFISSLALAQVLKNYDPEIKLSEKGSLFSGSKFASVSVDLETFPQAEFRIKISRESGLFLNGRLWGTVERDTVLYFGKGQLAPYLPWEKSEISILAYKKGISAGELSVQKGYFTNVQEENSSLESSEIKLLKRDRNRMQDFFFTALLSILFLFALLRAFFPSIFFIFWNWETVLSFEDLWESVGISKIYSAELLFYLFMINLGISLIAVTGIQASEYEVFGWGENLGKELNLLFLLWLTLAVILTVLTFLKFLWLGFNSYIFDLKKIALTHFFYLLKVVGLALTVVLLLLVVAFSNAFFSSPDIFSSVFWIFFGAYAMGILALMIWLSKKIGFKNYHLFSYLCTSELIPFLVIFKLILG
ncbi:MAG: DUF4271 domain-containing protein [Cyclobacteriaceae bacterium]